MAPTLEQFKSHFQGVKTKEIRGGHKNKVHTIDWSCDGKRLASGSADHTIRIWNLEKLALGSGSKEGATTTAESLADSSSGSSTLLNTAVSIEIKAHGNSVDQLAWNPTNPDILASASADKTVRIWNVATIPPNCIKKLSTGGENINLCWDPDGKYIAVGSKDDVVTIINVFDDQPSNTTHAASSTNPNNSMLDGSEGSLDQRLQFNFEVNEMTWSPDGQYFFMTTGSGTVNILEYPSFRALHTLQAHTANCYCIEFDPKNRYFAVGAADALVSLWDQRDLTCVRTFSNLDWPVRSLSFSHDGEFIASGSEDPFIDVSHVESGEPVCQIPVNAAINTIAWHPSKYLLAYAGDELDPRTGRAEGNLWVFGFSS